MEWPVIIYVIGHIYQNASIALAPHVAAPYFPGVSLDSLELQVKFQNA